MPLYHGADLGLPDRVHGATLNIFAKWESIFMSQ